MSTPAPHPVSSLPSPQAPAPTSTLMENLQRIDQTQDSNWTKAGSMWESLGDRDRAIECYTMALRHNAFNPNTLTRLGTLYREKENYLEAVECYEKALQIDSNNVLVWGALGHCCLMMDNLPKAHNAYQRALQLNPRSNDPNLWFGIGILYERMGNLDAAEEALNAVLTFAPNFEKLSEVHFRLAVLYKQHRKFEQAVNMFRLVAMNPPRPLSKSDIMFQIGSVYEAQGNFNAARETYEQILQQDPKHCKSMVQLGWLAFSTVTDQNLLPQAAEKALAYLQKATEMDPSEAQAYYYMGRIFTVMRQSVRAFEAFQQAVMRNGANPSYWCSIGGLYFQMNQPRDALDAYLRAIRLNPNLPEIWHEMGNLYESCNQLPDALDAYQHAMINDPNNRTIHEKIQRLSAVLAQKGINVPPLQATPGGQRLQQQLRQTPNFHAQAQIMQQPLTALAGASLHGGAAPPSLLAQLPPGFVVPGMQIPPQFIPPGHLIAATPAALTAQALPATPALKASPPRDDKKSVGAASGTGSVGGHVASKVRGRPKKANHDDDDEDFDPSLIKQSRTRAGARGVLGARRDGSPADGVTPGEKTIHDDFMAVIEEEIDKEDAEGGEESEEEPKITTRKRKKGDDDDAEFEAKESENEDDDEIVSDEERPSKKARIKD